MAVGLLAVKNPGFASLTDREAKIGIPNESALSAAAVFGAATTGLIARAARRKAGAVEENRKRLLDRHLAAHGVRALAARILAGGEERDVGLPRQGGEAGGRLLGRDLETACLRHRRCCAAKPQIHVVAPFSRALVALA
jgi:hypothetical protein